VGSETVCLKGFYGFSTSYAKTVQNGFATDFGMVGVFLGEPLI
jgi:hypothetical protein